MKQLLLQDYKEVLKFCSSSFKTRRKHTQCKPLGARHKVTRCGKCQALPHSVQNTVTLLRNSNMHTVMILFLKIRSQKIALQRQNKPHIHFRKALFLSLNLRPPLVSEISHTQHTLRLKARSPQFTGDPPNKKNTRFHRRGTKINERKCLAIINISDSCYDSRSLFSHSVISVIYCWVVFRLILC